jgi:hypothetical protein
MLEGSEGLTFCFSFRSVVRVSFVQRKRGFTRTLAMLEGSEGLTFCFSFRSVVRVSFV